VTIKINFFLFSIVAKVLFAFLVLFDSLLIARVAGEFATNGIRGVQGDIACRFGAENYRRIVRTWPHHSSVSALRSYFSRVFDDVWSSPCSNPIELLGWKLLRREGAPSQIIPHN
jgi:hypothetical protein